MVAIGLSLVGLVLLALACWASLLAYGTSRFHRLPASLQRNWAVRLAVDTLWFPFVAIGLWLALVLLVAGVVDTEASLRVAVVVALLFVANFAIWLITGLLSVFTSYQPSRRRVNVNCEKDGDGRAHV